MGEKTKAEVKERFADLGYPLHILGRNVAITDAMKSYAVDKLKKVDRLGGRILGVSIVMDVQKLIHSVDFIIDVNNTKIKVTGLSDNMYASIDQAIARLESKLSRYLRKLNEHHAKHLAEIDMNVNVISRITPLEDVNDQIEEANLKQVEEKLTPHEIVSSETRPLKTLTQEEAIMKMELSEDLFMVYQGEEDRKLKVIYRRNDGNYGIIEPER